MINTISKVKSIIPENFDGVLITNLSDMVYLTDLVGVEGFIIITRVMVFGTAPRTRPANSFGSTR